MIYLAMKNISINEISKFRRKKDTFSIETFVCYFYIYNYITYLINIMNYTNIILNIIYYDMYYMNKLRFN